MDVGEIGQEEKQQIVESLKGLVGNSTFVDETIKTSTFAKISKCYNTNPRKERTWDEQRCNNKDYQLFTRIAKQLL